MSLLLIALGGVALFAAIAFLLLRLDQNSIAREHEARGRAAKALHLTRTGFGRMYDHHVGLQYPDNTTSPGTL
jgi:hypothetical protein